MKISAIVILLNTVVVYSSAQRRISITDAINTAWAQNGQLTVNQTEIGAATHTAKTANNIPGVSIFAEEDNVQRTNTTATLSIGLSQSIAWPGVYAARKQYLREQLVYVQLNTALLRATIQKDVSSVYYQLWYLQDKGLLLQSLDSIYTNLLHTAQIRVKTGDAPRLDQIAADAQRNVLKAYIEQNKKEIIVQQQRLMVLLNQNEWLLPVDKPLTRINAPPYDDAAIHPLIALQEQNVAIADAYIRMQKNAIRPGFSGEVFLQTLPGFVTPLNRFSVSVQFPLLGMGAYTNKIRAAVKQKERQVNELTYQKQVIEMKKKSAVVNMEKNLALLHFYETSGLQQARSITEAASQSYRSGKISFAELSQFLTQAIHTRQNYLDVLNNYNQSVIEFNFLNHH